MLDDLKADKAAKQSLQEADEARRAATELAADDQLLKAMEAYQPTIDAFCSDSGWEIENRFFAAHPTSPAGRSLCFYIVRPEVGDLDRKFVFTLSVRPGLFFGPRFDTEVLVPEFLPSHNTFLRATRTWRGLNVDKLVRALRDAYKAVG